MLLIDKKTKQIEYCSAENITSDVLASTEPDMGPLRTMGMPVVTLKQNGWDYFDLHHTTDDTFDKINPADIAQNVAAYSAFVWMAANLNGHFRKD